MASAHKLLLVALLTCSGIAHAITLTARQQQASAPLLVAAKNSKAAGELTPAYKVFDVCASTALETALLLLVVKVATVALERVPEGISKQVYSQVLWILLVQGSSRIQGVCQQVGRTKQVLNPDWYESLEKPAWNPPAWAFPVAWIPLKLLQTFAAKFAWQAVDGRVLSPAMVLFTLHLALGDVWNVQFFLKQRPLTGVFVISAFWAVLLAATFAMYRASPLSGLLIAPTVLWVFVAANLNLDVWYLNR
jgi:benzodiazapine receptor